MDLVAIIRIAMRALARNKLRSILTMLGIIIGVGAVIAMVSVGQGAQQQAQQQIAAMGSNMLFVQSGTVNRGGMRMGWGATKTLGYDDMTAILRECPSVKAAAPGSQASAQVVFGNDNWATTINGTEPQYFDIRSWPIAEGSSFSQDDVNTAANVAVIGETVRKNLFGATDPIGQTVRINNLSFKVVGLLSAKGTSAAMGQDQDDIILVPITTLQKKITGQDWLRWIMVSAVSKDASYTAQQQITSLLRDRHRIRSAQDDDFFVRNLADMADLADQNARLFTILLGSIASISLLVGGIGIMNIMLVSVTERSTFGDRHEHDVHDADAAYEKGNAGDRTQQDGKQSRILIGKVGHVGEVAHEEIIVLRGTNAMAVAQQSCNLLLSRVAGILGDGGNHDPAQ